MEKKRKTKEETKSKAKKEKKGQGRQKPNDDRYWYDPDCGPVYKD
jgi:hypothetical protein